MPPPVPLRRAVMPGGGQVILDPKWRTFRLADGSRSLTSVTKILGKYFPFDAKSVAESVAMKTGSTADAVRAEWLKSAYLGTNVHAVIEATLMGEPIQPFRDIQGEEDAFVKVALGAIEKIKGEYDFQAQETIVASRRIGVAGTVDVILRNKATGRLMVCDWKTTSSALSSFRFGSFQTPADGYLSHLPNSKSARAAMQVLILGHIMKTEGYSVLLGPEIDNLEYGIINLGKAEDGSVTVTFDRVDPMDIVPPDMAMELSPSDVVRLVLATVA